MNATHGSDSPLSALREMNFFFPEHVAKTLALLKPEIASDPAAVEAALAQISEEGFLVVKKKEMKVRMWLGLV